MARLAARGRHDRGRQLASTPRSETRAARGIDRVRQWRRPRAPSAGPARRESARAARCGHGAPPTSHGSTRAEATSRPGSRAPAWRDEAFVRGKRDADIWLGGVGELAFAAARRCAVRVQSTRTIRSCSVALEPTATPRTALADRGPCSLGSGLRGRRRSRRAFDRIVIARSRRPDAIVSEGGARDARGVRAPTAKALSIRVKLRSVWKGGAQHFARPVLGLTRAARVEPPGG